MYSSELSTTSSLRYDSDLLRFWKSCQVSLCRAKPVLRVTVLLTAILRSLVQGNAFHARLDVMPTPAAPSRGFRVGSWRKRGVPTRSSPDDFAPVSAKSQRTSSRLAHLYVMFFLHGIIDFYLTTSGKVSSKDKRLYVTDKRLYKYRLLPQGLYLRFFNSSRTFAHAKHRRPAAFLERIRYPFVLFGFKLLIQSTTDLYHRCYIKDVQ